MARFITDETQSHDSWQSEFLEMLPQIKSQLNRSFRHLDPDSRDDAVAEGVVHCLLAYARLHEQGRARLATAASLAFFAARQVRCGRPAVGHLNSKDVLSRYAQVVRSLPVDRNQGQWIDEIVLDGRAAVPDQVAMKMDFSAWWSSLTERLRRIAQDLAVGWSTSEVAERHGLTAGRISQLRKALAESWAAFHHELQSTAA